MSAYTKFRLVLFGSLASIAASLTLLVIAVWEAHHHAPFAAYVLMIWVTCAVLAERYFDHKYRSYIERFRTDRIALPAGVDSREYVAVTVEALRSLNDQLDTKRALQDLIGECDLYVHTDSLLRHLSTDRKELYADAVDAWRFRLYGADKDIDPDHAPFERWWRE